MRSEIVIWARSKSFDESKKKLSNSECIVWLYDKIQESTKMVKMQKEELDVYREKEKDRFMKGEE
jgi:hypothetical protein